MNSVDRWLETHNRQREVDPATIAHNPPVYGLTGRFEVLRGREKGEYAEKCQAFLEEFEPLGLYEEELVLLLHDCLWRIKRANCEEQQIFNDHDSHEQQGDGWAILRLNQYVSSREKIMFRAAKELELRREKRLAAQKQPPAAAPPPFQREKCALWLVFERYVHPSNPIFNPQVDPPVPAAGPPSPTQKPPDPAP